MQANKPLRRIAAAGGDFAVLLFAAVAVWASFFVEDPDAYLFPRLTAALMLIFAIVNFCRRAAAGFAGDTALTGALLRKIAPAVAVGTVYLLSAETVGFYTAAAAAFFALAFWYGGRKRPLRVAIVTVIVIGVLYAVFSLALSVQTPRGFFF